MPELDVEALAAALAARQRPDQAKIASAGRSQATALRALDENNDTRHTASETAAKARHTELLAAIRENEKPGEITGAIRAATLDLIRASGKDLRTVVALIVALATFCGIGGTATGLAGRFQRASDVFLAGPILPPSQDATPTAEEGISDGP